MSECQIEDLRHCANKVRKCNGQEGEYHQMNILAICYFR